MASDTTSGLADEVMYVYTLRGLEPLRYAVLMYSAQRKRLSEWPAGVCFFDEHWKGRGACVVM